MAIKATAQKGTIKLDYGDELGSYSTSFVNPEAAPANVLSLANFYSFLQGGEQCTVFFTVQTNIAENN